MKRPPKFIQYQGKIYSLRQKVDEPLVEHHLPNWHSNKEGVRWTTTCGMHLLRRANAGTTIKANVTCKSCLKKLNIVRVFPLRVVGLLELCDEDGCEETWKIRYLENKQVVCRYCVKHSKKFEADCAKNVHRFREGKAKQ